jgi:hypothetical protein
MSAVEEMLAQARAAAEPSTEARARVQWAMKNALANPPVIDPTVVPPAAGAPFWGGSLGSYVTVGIIAAGLGLGAGWGASRVVAPQAPTRSNAVAPRTQQTEVASDRVPGPGIDSTSSPNAPPLMAENEHAPREEPQHSRQPPRTGQHGAQASANAAVPSNEPSAKDPLLFVVAALQRAQAELKNGHPLQALLLLDELDESYPGEVLLEERSAVRVHAQCAASRSPSSLVAARSFMRAHPASLYVDRIRHACGIE